jgi:hypothetical protein
MAGKTGEQERLFLLGYENGQRFLDGVLNKTIDEDEIRNKVPIGVTGAMAGPTPEFVLGRIYAAALTEAFDRIVKRDSSGKFLPVEEWELDQEVKKIRAETQFQTRNCDLLR